MGNWKAREVKSFYKVINLHFSFENNLDNISSRSVNEIKNDRIIFTKKQTILSTNFITSISPFNGRTRNGIQGIQLLEMTSLTFKQGFHVSSSSIQVTAATVSGIWQLFQIDMKWVGCLTSPTPCTQVFTSQKTYQKGHANIS